MNAGYLSGGAKDLHLLISTEASCALDAEAQAEWGFNIFALMEAAGRSCAQVCTGALPDLFRTRPKVTVAAGSGNNGVDAMVMLRYWILSELVDPSSAVVINRMPRSGETGPRVDLLRSLRKMKVPVLVWDGDIGEAAGRASDDILAHSNIIVDGIAGTGLKGPLHGVALEMVQAINAHRNSEFGIRNSEFRKRHTPSHDTHSAAHFPQYSEFRIPHSEIGNRPFVVSVDLPSGNSDEWKPGMPIIEADLTLAIEPRKYCIYTPATRPYAGVVLPVRGIFPPGIIASYKGAEFLDWEFVRERISKIRPDTYKNERGTVEVRAGSTGYTGAALIAARGAQAAGAGLVRLVVDDEIYPIIASEVSGIMVIPAGEPGTTDFEEGRRGDAILLGPGWGIKGERTLVLKKALALEEKGVPLILDADAIELARDMVFHGNVILTPHPGEFSRFTGIAREELLCRPAPILLKYAQERNAVILFKGHVTTIAAPDGRLGVVDGMTPGLAAGGSGDLLAGFCAAIAARMVKEGRSFDGYTCAAAGAALLIASGRSDKLKTRFTDPLELAGMAADLAGDAWLDLQGRTFLHG